MSAFFRQRVERTIEHMIEMLDDLDGDPDLEAEPVEEQHDREIDLLPPISLVVAARVLRKRRLH